MMIDFLQYGDRLENGIYREHSRFKHTFNFITPNNTSASIVTPSIGAGPQNIVIDTETIDQLETILGNKITVLTIQNNTLFLEGYEETNNTLNTKNKYEIPFNRFSKGMYHSHFSVHIPKIKAGNEPSREALKESFATNLNTLADYLKEIEPGKSLLRLIATETDDTVTSAFDRAYFQNARQAVVKIFNKTNGFNRDYLEGIKQLKGTGFGLTPGGDDFIAGILVALNVQGTIYQTATTQTIRSIYTASRSDNYFSNRFLSLAADGYLFESFNLLLARLTQPPDSEESQTTAIKKTADRLLAVGETSGADMCAGFLMCLIKTSLS